MHNNRFKPATDDSDKFCESFILHIKDTEHYPVIISYMRDFRDNQQKANALEIFMNMHKYIKDTGSKTLEEEFNRCLVQEAFVRE